MDTYLICEGSSMTDLYRTDERYERELQKISSWNILEKDKLLFTDFLRSMQACGIGFVQLLKYVQGMKTFLKCYNKSYNSLTRQDLERFLIAMQQARLSPKTQHVRWYSVKKFFDYLHLGNRFFKVRFEKTRHKLPEEILTEAEIGAMVECTDSITDACFIAVLYESGCRIGELLMMKKEDVGFDENGAVLIVDGKTGQRRIRIVEHARLLRKYILQNNIPVSNIITKSQSNRMFNLSWHASKKILKDAAARAGISKHVYPHLLRHSRATHLAAVLTDQQLKQFFGWTNASEMAAVYVHMSGRDIDQAILNYYSNREDADEKLKKMGIG
jgi:site-specific recombinase XerD